MRCHRRLAPALRAVLLIAAASSPAAAARLPEWARPIAENAPPVPEGVPRYPSRVLLSETRYAVQPDGTRRVRRRFATQSLSVNASQVGVGRFHFDDTMKVTASRAWHVPPGERAEKSWGPPVDITLGDAFLSDTKARFVAVRDVKKGSIVFFEFEATDKPRMLPLSEIFFEDAPVAVARLELETPAGWEVRSAWLRLKGPDPVVNGNVRLWEVRDLPAPEEEPMGDDPVDTAPMLVLNPLPPKGASVIPAVFPDWKAFSVWYEDLVKGRHDATPEVAAAAQRALDAAAPGFFERIRAAGTFVRDRVRYLDIELGIGGVQPRPASETLSNLYGDCKDKGTLFRSFLARDGIPSHPVLINAQKPETLSEDVPAWGFDHFVVAVPVPPEEPVPPSFAPAVVDAGDLGRLLIVDTTDEKTSIGSLSAGLAGKLGLVVAGDRGRLVKLPADDPAVHRMERRIRGEAHADRSVSVERTTRYFGDFAWRARDAHSKSSVDRRKLVERRVLQIWPEAAIEDYSADYETPEGAFVERLVFRLRPLPASGADSKVAFFPGAADDLERVPLGKRKTAVDYGHARTIRYEITYGGFPELVPLPAAQEFQGEGWSVRTTYAREGEAINATWEVRLERTRFGPEAFPELRKLWSAATSAASWTLSLPG